MASKLDLQALRVVIGDITVPDDTLFKVLVTGGREYSDTTTLVKVLDEINECRLIGILIQGECPVGGADLLAKNWARAQSAWAWSCPAPFGQLGSAAGPWRNARMLDAARPHLVVAFPGGAGTHDTVKKARQRHIPVFLVAAEE